jgi:hypothetical protein
MDRPVDALDLYEWKEEDKPYREWQVPAALLNSSARIQLLEFDNIYSLIKSSDDETAAKVRNIIGLAIQGNRDDLECPICGSGLGRLKKEREDQDETQVLCPNWCLGFLLD